MTRLRQIMVEEMQIRNLAERTQEMYVLCVARFARYFGQSPDQLGPEHVHEYFRYLTQDARVADSSRIVTACALRFLYFKTLKVDWSIEHIPLAKRERKLPVVLSRAEVEGFLEAVVSLKHRTMLMTIYSAGLRVSELTHLQVNDIDRERMVIHVRHGKGAKDRYTLLSRTLIPVLDAYLEAARPTYWVFPSHRPATQSRAAPSTMPASAHPSAPISASTSHHTRCVIASPRTYWKRGKICDRSSSCSATGRFARRPGICTSLQPPSAD